MSAKSTGPVKILLVDDSEDDRLFLRMALGGNPRLALIGEACDGEEAISYLSGEANFADREKFPFPDVMLLDLKMPRKTGYDVLGWLRTQPFSNLVVIVISGSLLPEDISKSLALGAAAYHRKIMLREERDILFREIEDSLAARNTSSAARFIS
jgi:CheY-like chemotaxis protein